MKLNYHSVDSGNCTYFFKEDEASYILPRICMIPLATGRVWSIHSCTSDGEPCSPYTNQQKIQFDNIDGLFSDTLDREKYRIVYEPIAQEGVVFLAVCKSCGIQYTINWRGRVEVLEECSCSSK